jgi:hypothetical protein
MPASTNLPKRAMVKLLQKLYLFKILHFDVYFPQIFAVFLSAVAAGRKIGEKHQRKQRET